MCICRCSTNCFLLPFSLNLNLSRYEETTVTCPKHSTELPPGGGGWLSRPPSMASSVPDMWIREVLYTHIRFKKDVKECHSQNARASTKKQVSVHTQCPTRLPMCTPPKLSPRQGLSSSVLSCRLTAPENPPGSSWHPQ